MTDSDRPDSVAQLDALLTGDQESRVRCLPVQSGNSCLLHTIFSPETNTGYINISIMNYIKWHLSHLIILYAMLRLTSMNVIFVIIIIIIITITITKHIFSSHGFAD